ncbi:hypothetical protein BDW60DRAFT_108409 [Aspergillus nidulans var. acristatus]
MFPNTRRSEGPCATELAQVSSLLPPRGPYEFSLLPTLTRPLEDLSKCLEGAKQTSTTANGYSPAGLVPLADSILEICQAACTAYGLVDDAVAAGTGTGSSENSPRATGLGAAGLEGERPSSSGASTWRCVKTTMTLGSLTLQDEEESLLARQIVYAVLTSLSALLREVYVREKDVVSETDVVGEGGVGAGAALYGREGAGAVSQCLSRVLALLGKIVPE